MSKQKKINEHFQNLSEDAQTYIESEIAYQKLDLFKKLVKATSLLLHYIINSSILLLAFAFLLIGLSLWLGYSLGYYFLGFLIVSGVLFIITVLMVIFAKPLFEKRVLKIFNEIFSDL